MHRRLAAILAIFWLALACRPLSARAKDAVAGPEGLSALLEMRGEFLYAGDPIFVRISVGSEANAPLANPVEALFPGFKVTRADGTPIKPEGKPDVQEPERPEKISPKSYYGARLDLSQVYPELRTAGQFRISWSAGGITANEILVRVIPKYDAGKDYLAKVETSEGSFTFEFLKKTAPIAVRAFIDMAHSGVYDGLTIHEIRPDQLLAGGDPSGDGSGSGPFRYPAELAAVPVVAGSVLMRPVSPSPPSNGSPFMVMLRPEPTWSGQVTVIGQVVEGLDVLQRISRLPSTQTSSRPYFKPLREIQIKIITILEKTRTPEPR